MKMKCLIAVLCISVMVNMFLVYKYLTRDSSPPKSYLLADRDLVDVVINDYAHEFQATPKKVMSNRFPVVIYLDDRKCVSLKLLPGSVGFVPVYCFSRADGSLVYKRLRQM